MAIYLKVDGITGDATDANHTDWIALDSFQFGTSRQVSARVGASTVREFSQPSLSDITVSKPLDKSSGGLFREAVVGNQGKTYTIEVTSTGEGGQILLTYTLTNVMVSNYHISSGGDRPIESISLNYTKIDVKFQLGQQSVTSYDLAKAQAS